MSSATAYTAIAAREGRWWVLTIEDIGVTQSRTLADAPAQAADMVGATLDVDPKTITVTVVPDLDANILAEADEARRAIDALVALQTTVAERSRKSARQLHDAGLTGQDIATVLNVSPQRVSQLLASSRA